LLRNIDCKVVQRICLSGKTSFCKEIRILAALRYIAAEEETLHNLRDQSGMSKEEMSKTLTAFVDALLATYEESWLRLPMHKEVHTSYSRRGFAGCIGCIDCTHMKWPGCPAAWRYHFQGPKEPTPAIVMEAVVDGNLYCWSLQAERPATNNDITVLQYSPLMNSLLDGKIPEEQFSFNLAGETFHQPYVLGDGIYPKWPVIVRPLGYAKPGSNEAHFSDCQDRVRKDVERFFGVLKGRFRILRGGIAHHQWQTATKICKACVILHNMIVDWQIQRKQMGDIQDYESIVDEFNQGDESMSNATERQSGYVTNDCGHNRGEDDPVTPPSSNAFTSVFRRFTTNQREHRHLMKALVRHICESCGM